MLILQYSTKEKKEKMDMKLQRELMPITITETTTMIVMTKSKTHFTVVMTLIQTFKRQTPMTWMSLIMIQTKKANEEQKRKKKKKKANSKINQQTFNVLPNV